MRGGDCPLGSLSDLSDVHFIGIAQRGHSMQPTRALLSGIQRIWLRIARHSVDSGVEDQGPKNKKAGCDQPAVA